ncbi:MAG TPA: hypothetical protein VKV96_02390 [Roseiarcus sp.]|nr:hypothetical protein [Roseiarcus sp.]
MSDLSDDTAIVFPVVGWEALTANEPICLVRIGYVRDAKEGEAVRAGHEPPIIPLGFTAKQCRDLALDLLKAANAIQGMKSGKAH